MQHQHSTFEVFWAIDFQIVHQSNLDGQISLGGWGVPDLSIISGEPCQVNYLFQHLAIAQYPAI